MAGIDLHLPCGRDKGETSKGTNVKYPARELFYGKVELDEGGSHLFPLQ